MGDRPMKRGAVSAQSRSRTEGRAPVLVEQVGSVLLVTLNRPSAMNALNADVAHLVAGAMDTLDSTPELRAGVLTGAGGNFSAGMDLKGEYSGLFSGSASVCDSNCCGTRAIAIFGNTQPPARAICIRSIKWRMTNGTASNRLM